MTSDANKMNKDMKLKDFDKSCCFEPPFANFVSLTEDHCTIARIFCISFLFSLADLPRRRPSLEDNAT